MVIKANSIFQKIIKILKTDALIKNFYFVTFADNDVVYPYPKPNCRASIL